MMPDDFEVILDRCLADMAAGRATIDSCLRRYPAQGEQLAVLLRIAERVRDAPPPAPLPTDKRHALESRLLRRAGQLRSKPAPRPSVWPRRVALALASFIVILLLLGSAVSVSAASVPGDFLYPVKRGAEQVRLTLASQQQRVSLYLEFAGQRLQEVRALRERGEVSSDLLAEISSDTAQVLDQIPALPQPTQQALLTSLASFEDQQVQVLEAMASSAQGEAQAAVMAALADSTARHKRALDLLAGAGSHNPPGAGSSQGPNPTGAAATQPAQGQPAVKPESTDAAGPRDTATPRATKVLPSNSHESTPEMEHTPPGQARQSAPQSPPGQARQTTPQSPPGQVKQQSSPESPPGHAKQNTPQLPPGQVKQHSTPESPPEKPVKTPKK